MVCSWLGSKSSPSNALCVRPSGTPLGRPVSGRLRRASRRAITLGKRHCRVKCGRAASDRSGRTANLISPFRGSSPPAPARQWRLCRLSRIGAIQRIASRLGNHSAQIELMAIKAKHKVPNGGRQICILPIGVDAGDQVGHCRRRASQTEGFDGRPAFNPAARPASVSSYV